MVRSVSVFQRWRARASVSKLGEAAVVLMTACGHGVLTDKPLCSAEAIESWMGADKRTRPALSVVRTSSDTFDHPRTA